MATIRRRDFLRAAAGAAAIMATPTILTAKKTKSEIILGEGEHQYEVFKDDYCSYFERSIYRSDGAKMIGS